MFKLMTLFFLVSCLTEAEQTRDVQRATANSTSQIILNYSINTEERFVEGSLSGAGYDLSSELDRGDECYISLGDRNISSECSVPADGYHFWA